MLLPIVPRFFVGPAIPLKIMFAFEESKSISENRPLVKNKGILALQFVPRINL